MGRFLQIRTRGWMRLALIAILIAEGCTSTRSRPALTFTQPGTRTLVKGIVTFQHDGSPQLIECGSYERLDLGTMGQGQYLYFRKRADEIQQAERQPVTAHLSGYLSRGESGGLIEQPTVLALSAGHCTEPKDPGLRDY
jgi:hypothetical protein